MTRASRPQVGRLRARHQQVLRTLVVPLVVALGVLLSSFALTPALLAVMPVTLLIAIYFALQAWTKARPIVEQGELGLYDGVVTVGRKRLVARDALTSGTVVPVTVDGTIVRLERRARPPIDLAVSSPDDAEAVLELLGLDAAHAVARFRVQDLDVAAWKRRMGAMVFAAVALAPLGMLSGITRTPWLMPLVIPPFVLFALAMVLPRTLIVGTDGIVVRRLGVTRFLPLDGVVDVVVDESELFMTSQLAIVRLLDAQGNSRGQILVDQKKQGPMQEGIHAEVDARAQALAERIRSAIALRRAAAEPFDRSSLSRAGRDAVDWVTHLAGLLSRTSTFRDQGPPTEAALLAIVEDAASPPIDRAAAAAALSRAAPSIRRRVRVAAEAIAAPKLRVAFEAASEGETERLAEALADLESLERTAPDGVTRR